MKVLIIGGYQMLVTDGSAYWALAATLRADGHEVRARECAEDWLCAGPRAKVAAERKTTASGVPADLIALYDKLRNQKGGVGAAALRRRECGGCGLAINPADMATIAAAPQDEVLRCEECSRILVRTPESGL